VSIAICFKRQRGIDVDNISVATARS
jgi:hypothetical protein